MKEKFLPLLAFALLLCLPMLAEATPRVVFINGRTVLVDDSPRVLVERDIVVLRDRPVIVRERAPVVEIRSGILGRRRVIVR